MKRTKSIRGKRDPQSPVTSLFVKDTKPGDRAYHRARAPTTATTVI